jgi:hypothetical protein
VTGLGPRSLSKAEHEAAELEVVCSPGRALSA